RMLANGPAVREVQPNPDGGTHTFTFAAEWHITAHGGASLQGNATLNQVAPLPIRVGVLELSPPDGTGYTLEFDALMANPSLPHQIPPFRQIRFAGATLAQPASLGGARVAVQGVLLPPDTEPAAAEKIHCGESCLSLRGPNDSLSVPDYKFRMPDLIIQNEASLLAYGDDNGMTIYSNDHPLAAAALNSISFSFEAFEGEISIRQGHCPGTRDPFNPKEQPAPEGPLTTIVEGTASMNIPGIGESNTDISSAPALTADFMLCALSLREVSLVLTLGDAAVPLGNSGLFLNKVGGYISVTPEATTITLEVGMQAMAPSADASNIFLTGWLMIDTRGLIDVHANARARVVGSLGYGATGHIWVGWGPLDIGFEVRGCLPHSGDSLIPKPNFQAPGSDTEESDLCSGNELLYGMIRAHLWQGAGWQDRYPHLLDSAPDATHFAGRFEADVTIAEGMVADWGLIKLPPVDIKAREVDLAVGEFCTNGSCTEYEWGVMGAYGMLGFQVGLYYDFGTDLHFILGSSDYCLIDEIDAAGNCTVNLQRLGRAANGTGEAFQVPLAADAGSALFGMAWQGGTPTFTLLEPAPGNRVIDAASVFPDVTVTITPTGSSEQVILAIEDPLPGDWIVQVDNLADVVDYDIVFFANEAPAVSFTVDGPAPITEAEATINWQTAVSDPDRYTLSFYWETRRDGRLYSGPIVERLPLSAAGSYVWNLDALPGVGASSPILVYAQIENGAAQVITACGDDPYSANPEAPCSTMTHADLGLAGARIPLGSIVYEDVVAPAAPVLANVRAQAETSVMVRWEPNSERDLAGYLVTCQQPGLTRQARLTPHYPGSSSLHEAVQVNGLDAGVMATCFVQAYDATGNLSAASATDMAEPTGNVPLPPAAPVSVGGLSQGVNNLTLSWGTDDNPVGFLVFYELVGTAPGGRVAGTLPLAGPGGGFRAGEGASPLDVGAVQSFTLTGLPTGATYKLWVKAYDAEGRTSPASEVVTLQVGGETIIYLPVVLRP
ncbi:MAG: fibronectin type III domain-containing protein, partial [Chloroflexota bacterium]